MWNEVADLQLQNEATLSAILSLLGSAATEDNFQKPEMKSDPNRGGQRVKREWPGQRRKIEAHAAPRVLIATLPVCPVDPNWRALERKRRLWWSNQRRHRWVARLATALLNADADALCDTGTMLKRDELRRFRHGWHVVVLVESVRHAAALWKLLAGWQLLSACNGDPDQDKKDRTVTRPGTIITLAALWKAGGIEADVLVRATGGRDQLILNGDTPTGVEVRADADIIIDFMDDSDQQTEQDTSWRIRDYQQQGLRVMEPDLNT